MTNGTRGHYPEWGQVSRQVAGFWFSLYAYPMPRKFESRDAYNVYMRDYMRRRYVARKEAAITQLGGKCVACGTVSSLEFDHIDPDAKNGAITTMLNGNGAKLAAELCKCQLLCVDCHARKTRLEGRQAQQGVQNPAAKLTEEAVLTARREYRPHSRKQGAAALARRFGVSKPTMLFAIVGRTWKHLPGARK